MPRLINDGLPQSQQQQRARLIWHNGDSFSRLFAFWKYSVRDADHPRLDA